MTNPAPASPVAYVLLDAALQAAQPHRFAALLAQFVAGYRRMFSGDEAESVAGWPARIAGMAPPYPVMRIALAVTRRDHDDIVIGGAAVEYYRAGGCALVTYVFVQAGADARRRGHARNLVACAAEACTVLGPVRALLAEVEWPPLLPRDTFAPAAIEFAVRRLQFFERLHARVVNLAYVQPALARGQRPVGYLKLLTLPLPVAVAGQDLRIALDRFLVEFHATLALESAQPVDTEGLARMRAELAQAQPLDLALHAEPGRTSLPGST